MSTDFDIVLNLTVPKELRKQLEGKTSEGYRVDVSASDGDDPAARFGIAETIVLLGLAKGVLEVVKLGVEVWNLLRSDARRGGEDAAAALSTPDERIVVTVTACMEREEVESLIANAFRTRPT
jgi:hypothetical protein